MIINKDHSIDNSDVRQIKNSDDDLKKKQASYESTKLACAQNQGEQNKRKILVCIGGSPFSKKLIYTARQMASDMDTQWMALSISKPIFFNYHPQNQNMIAENERLVDELGAEAYNVVGRRIADTIISFAKQHHIGHIIIGQPGSSFLFNLLGGMTVNRVIQKSGNITVHVIPGDTKEKSNRRTIRIGAQQSATSYIILTALIALMTLFLKGPLIPFDQVNILLLFLLPVLLGAALWGIGPGLYAAVMGVLSFDFFFVPPFQSLSVGDLRYISSFVIFLIVAVLTAGLSSGLKQQLEIAQQNERITSILYALSRKITIMDQLDQTLQSIVQKISETIGYRVAIYLPDEKGKLKNAVSSFSVQENEERERLIAEWTYRHGVPVGRGSEMLREMNCFFLPMRTEEQIHGVMSIHYDKFPNTQEHRRLIEAISRLTALAIVRARSREEVEKARLTAESEKLHVILLDSISHELRTPLSTMIGSATVLYENDELFSQKDRLELLKTIRHGAIRMNRIVTNLLGMVKLESGMLKLNQQWCDLEDIIGVSINQLKDGLQDRNLNLTIEDDLPPVFVDELLFEQALTNILSNAMKYSPVGSSIHLDVHQSGGKLNISVSDQGEGVAPGELSHIFDKFYRLKTNAHVPGTGLGLAIVKGIVNAHGASVTAYNNEEKGLTIVLSLSGGLLKNRGQ